MHDNLRLGGVVWTTLTVFLMVAAALALFVTVDSVRRSVRNGGGGTSGNRLWLYALVEGVYLAILLFVQFTSAIRIGLGAAGVLATPIAIGVGVAYLLRVVYPKPEAEPLSSAGEDGDGGPYATRSDDPPAPDSAS